MGHGIFQKKPFSSFSDVSKFWFYAFLMLFLMQDQTVGTHVTEMLQGIALRDRPYAVACVPVRVCDRAVQPPLRFLMRASPRVPEQIASRRGAEER